MRVEFAAAAEYELYAAVEHYNEQLEGLGIEFAAEVKKSLGLIEAHPQAWPMMSDIWRRHRVRRFPYGLVYNVDEQLITIVAVMHLAQDPTPWTDMPL